MNFRSSALLAVAARTVAGTLALSAALAFAQEAPDATIKRAVTEVTEAISADQAIQTGDRRRINALIDEKVMPYVNIARMTQSAMGTNWARATAEQRQALAVEFKRLLTNTYAGAFASYKPDTRIEYRPLRFRAGETEATVRSLVSAGSGEPISLDYHLEQADGAWKVIDLAVYGVKLVENYRGQFSGAISSSGIDGLIKALGAKNASNEARSAN
jgi:phospholipid transport system substrate-binding protein